VTCAHFASTTFAHPCEDERRHRHDLRVEDVETLGKLERACPSQGAYTV
jgi:recombinational DNA repair protein RecR